MTQESRNDPALHNYRLCACCTERQCRLWGVVQLTIIDLSRTFFLSLRSTPRIPAGSLLRAEIIVQQRHCNDELPPGLQIIAVTVEEPQACGVYALEELVLHSCPLPGSTRRN